MFVKFSEVLTVKLIINEDVAVVCNVQKVSDTLNSARCSLETHGGDGVHAGDYG